MPLADLATLDDVKAYGTVTTDATDAVLARLITSASAFLRRWTNRDITATSYDILRSGRGTITMQLPQYPIQDVWSVEVDGIYVPEAAGFGQHGFRHDDEQVILTGYHFSRGVSNVRIGYTAGFDEVPADIAQACIEMVLLRFKMRDKLDVASKTLAGETVSFTQRDMPPWAATVLRQYQAIAPL